MAVPKPGVPAHQESATTPVGDGELGGHAETTTHDACSGTPAAAEGLFQFSGEDAYQRRQHEDRRKERRRRQTR